jgi:hypothetical protein
MRHAPPRLLAVALLAAAALAPDLQAQTPRARLVAEVGGPVALPGGGTAPVVSLGLPVANGTGEVAFTGSLLAAGDTVGFVFVDDAVRWRNTDSATPLTGREAWMGAADGGAFIYSPTVDGEDGAWTDLGLLVRRGDPAPGFPGQFVAFASRPGMRPGGGAHWVSGLAATADGPAVARAFYVSPDRTAASATVVIAEGQTLGGAAVTALDFNYSVSDDGEHRAFLVIRAMGSSATDGAVVVDGVVVAQEGSAAVGGTELWQGFDLVRVNGGGHHLIAGETNGPTTADEVVAYDGAVVLREGMTVGGVALGADVRGFALEDDGPVAVYAWTTATGADDEVLFGGITSDLAATSVLLLRTGQGLDTSGDGAADYTVTDFEFSTDDGPEAIALGDARFAYVRLSLTPTGGGPPRDVIVGVDYSQVTTSAEPGVGAAARATLTVAPNPFRGEAILTVTHGRPGPTTVEVLDVLGRRVALLHEGPLAAGRHAFALDGSMLPAGVYVARAEAGGAVATQRVTVLR